MNTMLETVRRNRVTGRARAVAAAVRALSSVLSVSSPAFAQAFPERPVRFVVPIAPGGGADITTRAVKAAGIKPD